MPRDPAEDLLISFLERRANGEAVDFEALIAAHPEHAERLRQLYDAVKVAESLLPRSPGASLSDRIRAKFGKDADPGVTLDPSEHADDSTLLESLKSRGPASVRYRLKGEIAHGGMGAILQVYDQDLRRHLAMKVILEGKEHHLSRFLEEAQVTGQLDHPGIVPVHELGLDSNGKVYFTMKLVKGETLTSVFEKVATGAEGWNRTRALGVVLRVCEAMAFAHDKGVIHRDLKPSNIMVGKFGETYVMDWGLARLLGQEDKKDVRIRPDQTTSDVRTERRDGKGKTPESPLYTMDGEAIGTPAYMSPEQAKGQLADIGPHSDVYAVGAILYHLLTGRMPYAEESTPPSARAIVAMVMHGPPSALHTIVDDVPVELAAICEKAMARKIVERYPSMTELADDLRAYVEQRVVKAYETGALAELKKWVVRNKALAAAAALAVLATAAGLAGVTLKNREITEKNTALASANTEITTQKSAVESQRNVALARKAEFDQLAGVVLLDDAKKHEEDLYPAWPEKIPAMERWLTEDAKKLDDLKPLLAKTLADLEGRALPWTDAERESDRTTHPEFAKLEALRPRVAATRRAQAVRSGVAKAETPALPADLSSKSALELNDFAWKRVDPDASKRQFGDEPLALAAARAAVAKIEAGDKTSELASTLDTLAWALFANGLDVEAKAAEARALENAPEDKKKDYERYRANLETVIAAATGPDAEKALADAEAEVTRIQVAVDTRRTWRFEKEEDRFLHDTLAKLAVDIAAFESKEKHGVDQRLAWAQRIGDLTLHHPNARVTWDDARVALAKADGVVASTLYRESPIALKPETGLVPIGMNPMTKLWEFYELRSACDLEVGQDPATIEIPTIGEDGAIEVEDGTGIVFVLIPGGTFWQGAQKEDPNGPNFDPGAEDNETPQHVALSPYFLARHELTKGQWKRLTVGDEPSWYERGSTYEGNPVAIGWTHPVEQVSWTDCDLWMHRSGLSLPTEAQWERGARGTKTTAWWTGSEESSLALAANVLDQQGEKFFPQWGRQEGAFNDGFVSLAPVGQFRANPFGLFDTMGNVWEWCADSLGGRYTTPRSGDGLRDPHVSGNANRVPRGGSFSTPASNARSAHRPWISPWIRNGYLGLRPAKLLH